MNGPTVAVLMRIFEDAHTIGDALGSVWNQDYEGRIVVRFALDRGCRDRTHLLVREFADAHSRDGFEFVLGFHDHCNLLGATRWLLPQVDEPFAFFLDGDDTWFPHRLRRHMELYPPGNHRPVCAAGYYQQRLTERAPPVEGSAKYMLPIIQMRDVQDLELLLRWNYTGLTAYRVDGRYLRDRLAPAYRDLLQESLDANAVEDYFASLIATWDHGLCAHNGEALWVHRLIGRRPWEIPELIEPRMVAARRAFLRWAETHPSLRLG